MLAIQEEIDHTSTYPTYKPSHIDWIGEIPEHWILKRIGYVSDLLTGNPWKSEEFSFENGTKILRGENVSEGFLRWGDRTRFWPFPVEEESKFYLKQHDIVIAMDGSKVGKNYVLINESDLPILLHQRMCRIRMKSNYSAKFLEYFVSSEMFRHFIDISKTEPMIPHITQKNIFDFTYCVPPLPEQQAIVTYLDQKTALIDELIGKKQRKIDLLKEQRTALINHAVTKGLNPDVNFKDSGIDWIGEVPVHWEVKLLKYVADKIDEQPVSKELLFAVENIESHTGKLVGLDKELEYEGAVAGFKKGDTIFNKLRPYLAKVYYAQYSGGYFGELLTIRGKKGVFSKYLYYILSSKGFLEIVNSSSEGTKMPRANWETSIKLIPVPLPPISQQQFIVTYLDEQTALVDKTISLETQKIEKLKEYRQSLISAAVTGKICVLPFTEREESDTV